MCQTKDEQYINLSLYDVYRVTGSDGPPHGSGFVLRRSEPLSSLVLFGVNWLTKSAEAARNFRSMNDYMVKFTADSSTTYKMASAIYSAKVSHLPISRWWAETDDQSMLISQKQPELIARLAPKRTPSTSSKRPSDAKPLVDLSAPGQIRETGFTGKGLLAMI